MDKTIRRMLTLLLTLAVLFSLAAPAFAVGEDEAAAATETKTEEAVTEKETEEIAAEEKTEPAEEQAETKADEAKPEETQKAEASIAKVEISKAEEPKKGAEAARSESPAVRTFFVSENGNDDNDGSRTAPFATLAKAAKAANAAAEADVKIVLLSDLKAMETARFYGKNVTITSEGEKAFTVTRQNEFEHAEDEVRGKYNPAMIEVGTPEEKKPEEAKATKLTLEKVILDDAGRREAEDYSAQTMKPENREQNLSVVQDAVVAVYGEAELTMKASAQILNFGGKAAVYANGSKAKVALEDNSVIKDTMTEPELKVLPAVAAENDASVAKAEHAIVTERTAEVPAEEAKESADEDETSAEEIEDPEEKALEEQLVAAAASLMDGAEDSEEKKTEETQGEGNELLDDGDEQTSLADLIAQWTTGTTIPGLEELLKGFGINNISDLFLKAFDNSFLSDFAKLIGGGEGGSSASSTGISIESDPKTLVEKDDVEGYDITYTTSLDVSALIPSILKLFTAEKVSVTVEIEMDSRLTPDKDSVTKTGEALDFDEENPVTVEGNKITVVLSGKNIKGDALENAIVFTCKGTLPADKFEANKNLETTASLTTASITVNGTEYKPSTTVDIKATAKTAMASEKLTYDANGGEGGPGEVDVPVTDAYELKDTPDPTHADDENGRAIVFAGWTAEADTKIYKRGEAAPDVLKTTKIEEGGDNKVYAVYGYDEYGTDKIEPDGIADVMQDILILTYDANGGTGAPGPAVKEATDIAGIKNAKFDISSTEPTRKYYKFKGWAETKDAKEAKYKYNKGDGLDKDLTIHKDTTLYAVWEQNPTYSLNFNANGGTGAPSKQSGISDENGAVSLTIPLTRPTRTGYSFLGWGTSRVGSAAFQPGDKVTIKNGDVTLYAVWQRGSSGSSSSSTGGRVKTGDDANPRLYAAAALTALTGMMGAVYVLTRKPKKSRK